MEVTRGQGRRREQILRDFKETRGYWILKEEGGTRPHCVENSLWKRLWNFRKTDCGKNKIIN